MNNKQQNTPYLSKLKEDADKKKVPFDVPGHKRGNFDTDLLNEIGLRAYEFDSNAPRGLDNLNNPKGVIKEAEELAAEVFKADKCYFLTGGTTSGILVMIMSVCKANEKIIMPRNVHKSIINGLILSGGVPVFIKPDMDAKLGIANGVSFEKYKQAIDDNLDAVAVFLINPTYFGVVNDLEKIIDYAHKNNMKVIADEAHGGNLYLSDKLPKNAIEAGADISAISMHKCLGSLTQSSILLTKGNRVDQKRLRATLNILQSTSPNQLLIASIDSARKSVYYNGKTLIENAIIMVNEAIKQINEIDGVHAYGKDYFISNGSYSFDETKLIINLSDLGLTGFDAYRILVDEYDIQMELAENRLVLAIITVGTKKSDLDKLIAALKDLSNKYYNKNEKIESKIFFVYPEMYTRPRSAYHAPYKIVKIEDSLNEIASESVLVYPPGIPIIIPGEIVTEDIIWALDEYQKYDSTVLSDSPNGYIKVIDKEKWIKWEEMDDEIL